MFHAVLSEIICVQNFPISDPALPVLQKKPPSEKKTAAAYLIAYVLQELL
jgi:hypothetical protein